MMKLSTYLSALRPWSFSASLMPVMLGYTMAYKTGAVTSHFSLIITILTTLSVHTAGNIVNTYYDYVKGIDSSNSDDRTLVDHLLTKEETVILGLVLYSIGCLGFIILSLICPAKLEYLAIAYFGGLSSSFQYTGGIGLKYIAVGDILILVIFGPMTVMFSFIVQTGTVHWGVMMYAIPLALNSEAIFHANNTRDLKSDMNAGIVTLCIIIGRHASEVLYALFLLVPYSMYAIMGLKYCIYFWLPLITLPEAFNIERGFRTVSKKLTPKRTAKLNSYSGLLYILALYLTPSESLPFLA